MHQKIACHFCRTKKGPQKVFERIKPEDYESDVSNDGFFTEESGQFEPDPELDNNQIDLDSPDFDITQKYVYHETPKPQIYYSSVHVDGTSKDDIKHLSYNWVDTTPTVVSYKRSLSPTTISNDSDNVDKVELSEDYVTYERHTNRKEIKSDTESDIYEGRRRYSVLPTAKRQNKSSYVITSRRMKRSSKASKPQSTISVKKKQSDIYDFFEDLLETTLKSDYKIKNFDDNMTDLNSDDNNTNDSSFSNSLASSTSSSTSSLNTVLNQSSTDHNDRNWLAVTKKNRDAVMLPVRQPDPRPTNRYSIVIPREPYIPNGIVIPKESEVYTDDESLLKEYKLNDSVPASEEVSFNFDSVDNTLKEKKTPAKILEEFTKEDEPAVEYIDMYDRNASLNRKKMLKELKPRYNAMKKNMEFLKMYQYMFGNRRNSSKKQRQNSAPRFPKRRSINPKHKFIKVLKKRLSVENHMERSDFYVSLKNMARFRNRMIHENYFADDRDTIYQRNGIRRVKKKCGKEAKQLDIMNRKMLSQLNSSFSNRKQKKKIKL